MQIPLLKTSIVLAAGMFLANIFANNDSLKTEAGYKPKSAKNKSIDNSQPWDTKAALASNTIDLSNSHLVSDGILSALVPPVAILDVATTAEDTPVSINVIANDTDLEGNSTIDPASVDLDPLTIGIQNTFVSANGSWATDASGVVTFTPSLNYFGIETISYTVNDIDGLTSNAITITVMITAEKDAPVAVNDTATTQEDTAVTINLISNDTDADGTVNAATVDLDPLAGGIQDIFTSANGGWSLNASGIATFTPSLNYNGTAGISYTVNDNDGLTSNTATVTVTVSAVNDAPVATNDNTTTPENTAITINVVVNDTDTDGTINAGTVDLDPATIGIQHTHTSTNGTWTADNFGIVSFIPSLNYHGTASIFYTVNDNEGLTSNTATVTVSVSAVNTAPVANNDEATTPEDTEVTLNVIANDTDADGTVNAATVDLNTGTIGIQNTFTSTNGTWSVNASGVVTFTPSLNYNGTDSISYTINDNEGLASNAATVTVTVSSVNDAPVANNDTATTPEDTAVTINVVADDNDADGTINVATVDLNPATIGIQNTFTSMHGSWSVNASGIVTFTPSLNYNGTESISYKVNDNEGLSSNTATVTVTVSSVNDAPIANNDSSATPEDTEVTLNVIANDTDADGTVNAATVDLNPSIIGIQNIFTTTNGTWSVNASGVVTFTPPLDYKGTESISYTVNDDEGLTSNTATITVSVSAVNDAPIAANDSATTAEDTAVTINVVANDTDADGTVNAGTVDLNTGTIGIQNTFTSLHGTWSVNASGVVTFTPSLDYKGTESISYTVNDNAGLTSNSAAITVTITSDNDAPIAVNDSTTTPEDTVVTINVTANDTDADGTLNVATVDLNPATSGIQSSFSSTSGTWSVSASGVVTFTPSFNFHGSASISYTVNDNEGLTSNMVAIIVTVSSVNDAPIANNDTTTTPEDTAVTINVIANDTDADGTINDATVDLNPGATGIQNTFTSGNGTWSVNASGVVTFTPAVDYKGTVSISYTVNDNEGLTSNMATIIVTVSQTNDAPVAVNDTAATPEDTSVTINVIANDTDADGAINAGTVDLNPATIGIQKTFTSTNGTWSVNASGIVTFSPSLNYHGAESISYTVDDNGGLTSNTATITVAVTSVNDGPVANNDNATTPEDTAVTINVIANDTDVDGTVNGATVDLNPAIIGIQNTFTSTNGSWSVNASGVVTFTPSLDYKGAESISYTVSDNEGLTSNTATITVTVSAGNDAPVAVNDTATTPEETAVTINVIANDTDDEGTINAATVDLNPAITGIQNTFVSANGTWSVNASGQVTFIPSLNYHGTENISYTVNDNDGLTSNTATITVTVSSINDTPVAENDLATTPEGVFVEVNVLANDTDADSAINPATVDLDPNTSGIQSAITTSAGTWQANVSGLIKFTPATNFSGSATISYTVNDDQGAVSNIAVLTIQVGSCFADLNADCDGDGVTNGQESADGTDPNLPCSFVLAHQTLTVSSAWNDLDCDGDGVRNKQEITDHTDPSNPCISIPAHIDLALSQLFLDSDCDGDGLSNGLEIGNTPKKPHDSNGNGIPDYLEKNNFSASEDDVEIFNLVTPNGDGDNDVFVIRNIEMYPDNNVAIFNRWGTLVYEVNGYGQNQAFFKGISEGKLTVNQSSELPAGTYYYVLKYKNAAEVTKERSGYLFINR